MDEEKILKRKREVLERDMQKFFEQPTQLLCLTVSVDCQVDRIRNYKEDKLQGTAVGGYLDWVNLWTGL